MPGHAGRLRPLQDCHAGQLRAVVRDASFRPAAASMRPGFADQAKGLSISQNLAKRGDKGIGAGRLLEK
jgi:hypothetical protein